MTHEAGYPLVVETKSNFDKKKRGRKHPPFDTRGEGGGGGWSARDFGIIAADFWQDFRLPQDSRNERTVVFFFLFCYLAFHASLLPYESFFLLFVCSLSWWRRRHLCYDVRRNPEVGDLGTRSASGFYFYPISGSN